MSRYGAWHLWFAWRPVKTQQYGWRWLRYVHRAKHYPPPLIPGAPAPYWVYRPTKNDRRQP